MSIIGDGLRQEENIGGFQAETDDTFMLENKDYEGDLPDFSQQTEELNGTKLNEQTIQAEEDEVVDEAELIDASSTESIWDSFNEESEEPMISNDDLETEESSNFEKAGIEEAEEDDLFAEQETDDIEEFPSEVLKEQDEEDEVLDSDGFLEEDEEITTKDDTTFDDVDPIPTDEDEISEEDLTSFISEELERSRKRKEESDAQGNKNTDDVIETNSESDFKPVDDSEDVIEIDLSSYSIDSYSNMKDKKDQKKVPPKQDNKTKPSVVEKQKQPKSKKDRKKLPVWIPAFSAVAIILLSLLIGAYYLYDYNGIFGLFSTEDSSAIADESKKSEIDSTIASEQEISKKEQADSSESIVQEEPTEELETNNELTEDVDSYEVPKKKIAKRSKPVRKDSKDFRTIPKVNNQAKPEQKHTNSSNYPEIINHTKDIPFSLSEEERGVYTVQIYSTLSEDDALDWLVKLKLKNINSAFISQQKIRDKVWYRVRFGAFQTKQDAKEAADRYGFAQSWIDRVK